MAAQAIDASTQTFMAALLDEVCVLPTTDITSEDAKAYELGFYPENPQIIVKSGSSIGIGI